MRSPIWSTSRAGRPFDGKGAAFDQGLECAPAEPELHRELHDRQELDHPQIPAAQPVPRLGRGGVPGDQRPVQVEERADIRALRARVDFRRRPEGPRRRVSTTPAAHVSG
jgi:hypothetical protein